MKKIVLIIIVMASSLLFAEGEIMEKFTKYQEEPTFENFQTAISHYEKLIKADAGNTMARTLTSYLYMMRLDETVEYFEANFDSLETKTKFQYGNLLLEMGKYKESIEIYNDLNEASPKWSCPWRHKGEAFYRIEKMEKAEEAFLKAIETRAEHYDAYVWLAKAQKELGKYKEALKSLETGLSYKGKDIEDPEEEVATSEVDALHEELKKIAK